MQIDDQINDRWLSHGPGSSLIEHTGQVLSMGETLEEKVAAICHDVGKATEPWQARARAGFHNQDGTPIPSPHRHAEWGGVLAYFILEELGKGKVTKATLLHAVAAHHSVLEAIPCNSQLATQIGDSQDALDFAIGAFQKFLPAIEEDKIRTAWQKTKTTFGYGELESLDTNSWFTEEELRELILRSRRILARLVYFDTRSAANQDPKTRRPFNSNLPSGKTFKRREARHYNPGRLSDLRDMLKAACLEMEGSYFYSVEAPTGLGKTEAMLSLAEKLILTENKKRIVYAVPQISICEQIVSDYMTGNEIDAQVWNFRTKETVNKRSEAGDLANNQDRSTSAAVIESPFSSSYNITTFNQIVLAMLNPHRNHCVRSLWLKDAVIIMDEIHKLPIHCLMYFLPLANLYAEQNNCAWVLGSATSLPDSKNVFHGIGVRKLSAETTTLFNKSSLLYQRRAYQRIEDQTAESVAEQIRALNHEEGSNLFLLSLVEKGTFAVAKLLGIPTDPYNRVYTRLNPSHPIVWLDGSVPPLLRQGYLTFVKERLVNHEAVTLLTTQVVEAGVDLDFETGWTDFISLPSLLQRGGRVAREARADDTCRTLHVFNLTTIVQEGGNTTEKTTKQILDEAGADALKLVNTSRNKIREILVNTQQGASAYFELWQIAETRGELDLLQASYQLSKRAIDQITRPEVGDVVTYNQQSGHLGFMLGYLDTITQLYGDEPYGETVIPFGDLSEFQEIHEKCLAGRREGFQELSSRRITIHRNIVQSLIDEGFSRAEPIAWEEQTLVRTENIV
jgi:CRISPR-associated endonuclease Cas3-HD